MSVGSAPLERLIGFVPQDDILHDELTVRYVHLPAALLPHQKLLINMHNLVGKAAYYMEASCIYTQIISGCISLRLL